MNSRVSFVFFRIITTINRILCDYKKLSCSLTYSLKLVSWFILNGEARMLMIISFELCAWRQHGLYGYFFMSLISSRPVVNSPCDDQQLAGDWWWNMKQTADSKRRHLLIGDPPSFSQRLLIIDVDRIDADEPEWHTEITSWYLTQLYLDFFFKISSEDFSDFVLVVGQRGTIKTLTCASGNWL